MIIVITNRFLNPDGSNANLFGEKPNSKGLDELRLAKAEFGDAGWQVELLPEGNLEAGPMPSQLLFQEIMEGIQAGTYRQHWVFYIHGFNQSFAQTLEASREISRIYDVDVILFSWPSNPGGFVTDEYKQAKQAARASANAIDRALGKLADYLINRPQSEIQTCRVSINLLVHSLGNYLVENFVRRPIFLPEKRIFDNILFHQADVDNHLHRFWVDRLSYSRRIYITINEEDLVLKASDLINPGRLGNTLQVLNSAKALYIDFTFGSHIRGAHTLFLEVLENVSARQFFQQVFWGARGEDVDGFQFDARINAFRLRQ